MLLRFGQKPRLIEPPCRSGKRAHCREGCRKPALALGKGSYAYGIHGGFNDTLTGNEAANRLESGGGAKKPTHAVQAERQDAAVDIHGSSIADHWASVDHHPMAHDYLV
ncbi:MAG TPA: hypothetical protein VF079_07870 [Sphingomicrobium sp.]